MPTSWVKLSTAISTSKIKTFSVYYRQVTQMLINNHVDFWKKRFTHLQDSQWFRHHTRNCIFCGSTLSTYVSIYQVRNHFPICVKYNLSQTFIWMDRYEKAHDLKLLWSWETVGEVCSKHEATWRIWQTIGLALVQSLCKTFFETLTYELIYSFDDKQGPQPFLMFMLFQNHFISQIQYTFLYRIVIA